MDYRLYILAGSFVFLVVSIVVLVVATTRARKASNHIPDPDVTGNWPMLKPAPEEVEASIMETFSEPTSGVAAVLNEPIRTGAWQPETPEQEAKAPPRSDYWDSLIEEPSLLMKERVELEPTPPPVPQQPPVRDESSTSAVAATVVHRAEQDAEIDQLIEGLVEQPAADSTPEEQPKPAVVTLPPAPSAPTPPSIPQQPSPPTTTPAATEAPSPPSVPSSPAPPEPTPAAKAVPPTPAPVASSPPAAQPEPEPASTPPVSEPVPEPAAPAPAPPARPAPPGAQTARVTPVPIDLRTPPQQQREVPSAKREQMQPTARPQARIADQRPDNIPTHELVAPIEMWFGDDRVGVKPGSRTYDLFQKYARVLLDDLRRAKTSTLV